LLTPQSRFGGTWNALAVAVQNSDFKLHIAVLVRNLLFFCKESVNELKKSFLNDIVHYVLEF